jgi:hypothetical protein
MGIRKKWSFPGCDPAILHHLRLLRLMMILLCAWPPTAIAQTDSLHRTKYDVNPIVPRYPAAHHLEELRKDRDFQYQDDPTPPANPAAKWINWFFRKLRDLFYSPSYENFWQYAILATVVGLVLFLLYKAGILAYVFPNRVPSATTDYIVGQENIHEIDFDETINLALAGGDYRLAIRLQYLHTLKTLSVKKLIDWKPNLTNQRYVQELKKYPFQADFLQLTRYFEFAWYGDFKISKSSYEEMKAFSRSFHDKLNQRSHV